MPQQVFGSLANCAGEGLTPGDAVVKNRYAEARPNAAAIIAACWSGGAIEDLPSLRSCRSIQHRRCSRRARAFQCFAQFCARSIGAFDGVISKSHGQ